MNVDGVKVIVQPSNNEIVEVLTIIKGGVQNYTKADMGIEALALNAITECGTANDSKNFFKNKLDNYSARIDGSAGVDFSTIGLNCIKMDIDKVWPLYVDAITKPAFNENDFVIVKQDAVNNLKERASEPDFAIDRMAKEIAFKGQDYEKNVLGTEQIINATTAAQAKAYYNSILTKSRLTIVVVGEIEKMDLEKMIGSLVKNIPEGKPFILRRQGYIPASTTFASEKKEMATNYIQAVTGGPAPGTKDFNAFKLAMEIFYDKHFLDVRTKNGLSYAPGSWFDGGAFANTNVSVSTTEPNKYIAVFNNLIKVIKEKGFDAEEVKNMKTVYLSYFWYYKETNSSQAESLASNEVLHNNWKRALTISDDLKKLTREELNQAFNKYITNITWAYQGDPKKVDPNLFTGSKQVPLPKSKVKSSKKG